MESIISNERSTYFSSRRPGAAIWLAMAATATALSISALAGWQRGGSLAERLVWVSISLVLVVSAHVLPAFAQGAPVIVRCVAWSLWAACMATACYGHATFFVLAQRHAGELRASSLTMSPAIPTVRSLTAVMTERATVVGQLATARARYCAGNCATLEARRARSPHDAMPSMLKRTTSGEVISQMTGSRSRAPRYSLIPSRRDSQRYSA